MNKMFVIQFLAALLLLVVVGVVDANHNNEIAVLTDENFEHDTQATTGSTTGSWLILFHNGVDPQMRLLTFREPL